MKTYLTFRCVIGPGSTAQILVRPHDGATRPLKLRVVKVDPVSNLFDILDVKVGNKSQFAQATPLPAEHCISVRTDHIEAIARWIEDTRGYLSIAEAIRKGSWKPPGMKDDDEGVDFPCDTIQTAMDFTMIVTNRDVTREAEFCAVWTCETVHRNWSDFTEGDLYTFCANAFGVTREEAKTLIRGAAYGKRAKLSGAEAGAKIDAEMTKMRNAGTGPACAVCFDTFKAPPIGERMGTAIADVPEKPDAGVGWDPYGDDV